MNRLVKISLLVVSVIAWLPSFSQNQTAKSTPGGIWYYEYLPADYNSNTDDYPIVFFFHGLGERGNTETSLTKVAQNGPPKHVKNGVEFPFILISPQLKTNKSNWPSVYMNNVVEHVKTELRIDLNRLYVTGLSLGGGGAWYYAQDFPEKVAALAPVCGSRNKTALACGIAAENIPTWAFHGDADGTVSITKTIAMINAINNCVPAIDPTAIMTTYAGVGHNSWSRAYRTDNNLHTPNVYEWMMAQSKSSISANAGPDVSVNLPTNSTTITGSGTSDAAISTYLWEITSGPAATLANASTPTVTVNGLVAGVYNLRLTVTDINAKTASDDVIITVTAANVSPTANAGLDQTIKLPVNSVTLTGIGTDTDGSIASYLWAQTAGPSVTLSSTSNAVLNGTNMVVGVYTFQLTVTDDDGATATDFVTVTVQEADNLAPTSNAGPDRTLNLPTSTMNISGSASDSDGTISTYLWEKMSGPTATLTNASSPTLSASALLEGVYVFRLTATDDDGASDTDDMTVTVSAANQSPSSNAGSDINITQPTSTTNVAGSASDPDGTIASYLWEFISGPAIPSIANSTQSSCTVSGMSVVGNYVIRLTATDDDGASASDNVTITVNSAPINEIPTVDAGADQNITLPTNTVVLSGSATDLDGTIASYAWAKISGGAANLTGATTATLTANNLVAGSYTFRLTATDNDGGADFDDVIVTVNPAAVNESPTANAGVDQVVTLPIPNAVFTGSGTDNDGTIASYAWVQLSGASLTLAGAATPTLTVSNIVQGTFTFELTVTDDDGAIGSDIVQLTANNSNSAPVADAGSNQIITLPTNSITVNGSATDSDGTIVSYLWTQESGPSIANYSGANTLTFFVTNMINGIYTFRLLVTDDDGATHFDEMNITVNEAVNSSPTANAGADKSIDLPTNSVNITGFASDSDGTISSTVWTLLNGPSSVVFANENTLTVTVSSLIEGVYTFRLTATDDDGAMDFDDMDVTVVAEVVNSLPTADAGSNMTITLPTNSTTLTGSGSDPDGTIASYSWIKTGGPAATLTNENTSTLSLSNLVEGNYTFRLTVTDDSGGQDSDEATVNVLPAIVNDPPVANAGADIQLLLPINGTNIVGSGSDTDGSVVSYDWIKVSGGVATLTNPTNPTLTLSDLVEDTYTFELTVTDDIGATATDQVIVTVLPASANVAPVASAGSDRAISLPTNSLTISGSGSDSDGTIIRYTWTKTSGPSATLSNADNATLTVNDLIEGSYTFQLEVEDNNNAVSSDDMDVQVFPETVNTAPAVDAGIDMNTQLPANSLTLAGSASDTDGTIASVAWTKVSGGAATIATPATLISSLTDLVEGDYVFRLTATDDDGATNSDEVGVQVLAATANVPPIAGAGQDQTIKLPTNSITIQGSASDGDGTISGLLWTKISGPSATLTNADTDALAASDLIEGVYVFRLTVTDDDGATDDDDVTITVLAASINTAPSVSLGGDRSIQLPENSVALSATITDDGVINSINWVLDSGPSSPTLNGNGTADLTLTDLVVGTYMLHITVTDDGGLSSTDDIEVIVLEANPVGNEPPVVDAGADLTIAEVEVTIAAFGNDPDGLIRDFTWIQTSGPAASILTPGSEGVVTISNLVVGDYTFMVTVSDFDDAIGSDEITITVAESADAISPMKLFSPNGDSINDLWEISNNTAISECSLIIFDRKGSIVYETVGYNNDWDGTRNGSLLPEGVYYFVVRCGGKQNDKTGSITLLR